MAVVDKAEREVVVELGVPLSSSRCQSISQTGRSGRWSYGPISDGVTGSEGGGGRLIKVGVVILLYARQEVRVFEIRCRADLLDGGDMEADLAELELPMVGQEIRLK